MIQGGDPSGDGTGGSDETIKGEFSDNGVENNISHVRGTISMARSSEMTVQVHSSLSYSQTVHILTVSMPDLEQLQAGWI